MEKLCNEDGGDWMGKKNEKNSQGEKLRKTDRDLFRYIVGVFCFWLRPQQDFCWARVSVLPPALE